MNWLQKSLARQKLRQQLNQNPYYRFKSVAEVVQAASMGVSIDVNQAGVDDWLRLPGISIHQARSLVELIGQGVQILCLEDLAAALGVSVTRLEPLRAILSFQYYDTQSWFYLPRVNPNRATEAQLATIPFLDPSMARSLVEERQQGQFSNLADLQHRLGWDSELTAQLMHYFRF